MLNAIFHRPQVTIYIDLSATTSIVKQTKFTFSNFDKFNLRFIRANMYFSQFEFDVKHKPGKFHIVSDVLSRFAKTMNAPRNRDSIFEEHHIIVSSKFPHAIEMQCYPINLIQMSSDFKRRLKEKYDESQWKRVRRVIQNNKRFGKKAATFPYKVIDGIMYFKNDEKRLRFCIPSTMETKIFQLIYDEMSHPDYVKIQEGLTDGLYIRGMTKKLHEFIKHCPQCQFNQTFRHRPYGSFQPIFFPAKPFHTITIDFILILLESINGFNCATSIRDKFNNTVTHIHGMTI